MFKKYLLNQKKALEAKRDRLIARSQASEDIDEVRAINDEVAEIAGQLKDIAAQLDELANEEDEGATASRSTVVPAEAKAVNTVAQIRSEEKEGEDKFGSMEYRMAFKEYVQTGEVRNGSVIDTGKTGAMIPSTVMNEVINTLRGKYGNLYAKVRKISVPGGVEFPIGALEAEFKWISESTVSPRQDIGTPAKVSFGYYTAEIRIAQTFLSSIVTLSAFEAEITKIIAKAYLKAMDYGIVKGSGNGTMTGILNDARVTNNVTMTSSQMGNWTEWKKRLFSKIPMGYQDGEFIFANSTVVTYLETMADSNNNPIFKEAAGLAVDSAGSAGKFFGRDVALVESDIIQDFDTASSGDVIGIFWQPEEYAINENFGFTMRRYFDEETNEYVDKALVVVDGKVLNPTGYYLIKKA